jgi:hypothetical protein
MFMLACRAYLLLICIDRYLAGGDFSVMYERVRRVRLRKRADSPEAIEAICRAIDIRNLSAAATRHSCSACHWRAVHAVPSACVGRSRGKDRQ